MHRFSIYPRDDKPQKLRIQRLFSSVLLNLLCCIPFGLFVYNGIVPLRIMLIWLSLVILSNTVLYFFIRLSYNKRMADPSLTVAQLVLAIGLVFYAQIYAGPVRGSFLLVLMVAFAFGCFKLTTRQLLRLSLLAIVTYAATLPIISRVEGSAFRPAVEISLWVAFSVFIPALAIIAGNISQIRKKLAIANSLLEDAIRKATDLATHDELTGAYNRRHLLEMLSYEKHRADHGDSAFCICMFDLDHFKHVNDTYGHAVGDEVLKKLATAVHTAMRNTDLFARYGGEEFILLLPRTSLELAEVCVERITNTLQSLSFESLPSDFRITTSIGIAQYNFSEEIGKIVERVDAALYEAKRRGRNRIELAKSPTLATSRN